MGKPDCSRAQCLVSILAGLNLGGDTIPHFNLHFTIENIQMSSMVYVSGALHPLFRGP